LIMNKITFNQFIPGKETLVHINVVRVVSMNEVGDIEEDIANPSKSVFLELTVRNNANISFTIITDGDSWANVAKVLADIYSYDSLGADMKYRIVDMSDLIQLTTADQDKIKSNIQKFLEDLDI